MIKYILKITFTIALSAFPLVSQARDYSEWLDLCEEYRESVETILRNEGVDIKYYYLMVAESKCTKQAQSDKGAAGFWQMMPQTARAYGCNDLHDYECSTRAAAKYIKHLQNMFKYNFDDVVQGYNIGGRNYKRIGKTHESGQLLARVKAIMETDK